MKLPYYPGCTLYEKAKDLDQHARQIALAFDVELVDIPDWTCCGAVFPNSHQDIMKFAGSYRMLAAAEKMSDKLLTLCSACFNVLKRLDQLLKNNPEIHEKLRNFTGVDYQGSVQVIHYIEFLKDIITFDQLKSKITSPQGRDVSPYYGCLLLRPHDVLQLDDPENPVLLSQIIQAAGDKCVEFSAQNECCGGCLTVQDDPSVWDIPRRVCRDAKEFGGQILITSCPLCYYNLGHTGEMNVMYFTGYLAQVLGLVERVKA